MDIGNYREGQWIETYSGQYVNPTSIEDTLINIGDIAESLSKLCRFVGHCNGYYSVAEHSVLMSRYIQKQYPDLTHLSLAGLLHDASEAYTGDMSRPMKDTRWKELETQVEYAIQRKFRLCNSDWHYIKLVDNAFLKLEANQLMNSKGREWYFPNSTPLLNVKLYQWNWKQAKAQFMRQFNLLTQSHQ